MQKHIYCIQVVDIGGPTHIYWNVGDLVSHYEGSYIGSSFEKANPYPTAYLTLEEAQAELKKRGQGMGLKFSIVKYSSAD
jgi:hypothetical protein